MANHVFFRDVWANKALDEDVRYAMDFMRQLSLENDDGKNAAAAAASAAAASGGGNSNN